MSVERVTIPCPHCRRPISLRVRLHIMADGEVVGDRRDAKAGMVIHVTKGCIAR